MKNGAYSRINEKRHFRRDILHFLEFILLFAVRSRFLESFLLNESVLEPKLSPDEGRDEEDEEEGEAMILFLVQWTRDERVRCPLVMMEEKRKSNIRGKY